MSNAPPEPPPPVPLSYLLAGAALWALAFAAVLFPAHPDFRPVRYAAAAMPDRCAASASAERAAR